VCNYLLNLLPQRENMIREMYRVLKPTGHLIMSDIFSNKFISSELNDIMNHKYLWHSRIEIITNQYWMIMQDVYFEWLKNIGFANVTIKEENIIDTKNGEILLLVEENDLEEINNHKLEFHKIVLLAKKW
jgi:ubiquinone/menaquinone biosynthesis C-methylase UbiE